jgi:hypothetical protein
MSIRRVTKMVREPGYVSEGRIHGMSPAALNYSAEV